MKAFRFLSILLACLFAGIASGADEVAFDSQGATVRMAEVAPERLPILERASKVRMAYLGEQTNAPADEGATDSEASATEPVEVPVRLEVSSLHSAGATLEYFEEGGMGITVCAGGIQVSAGNVSIRADSAVVWQPLGAEKKTPHFPSTPRSMLRVT